MRLEVRGDNISLQQHTRHVIEKKARLALGRVVGEIAEVRIVLHDINGPRKGVDRACAVVVRLRRGGQIRVESVEPAMHDAVDRSLDRVARSVYRTLARQRRFDRDSIRFASSE